MAFLTAGESVERMASHCRIEQMLFGVFGGWAGELKDPNAKIVMLSTADHCAWRAKRWYEMLPTAPPGPDALLTPTMAEREAFALVSDLVGSSQGAQMVVAYQSLLPALHRALTEHLERTTTVADGPIRRMLRIALTDVDTDLASGVGPMEAVLAAPGERDHAERISAQLSANEGGIRQLFQV